MNIVKYLLKNVFTKVISYKQIHYAILISFFVNRHMKIIFVFFFFRWNSVNLHTIVATRYFL